jgi:hypothetical protein
MKLDLVTTWFVIVVVSVGCIAYALGQTVALRAVERWLRTLEAEQRAATQGPANVMALIELPGYQAVLRRFISKFR